MCQDNVGWISNCIFLCNRIVHSCADNFAINSFERNEGPLPFMILAKIRDPTSSKCIWDEKRRKDVWLWDKRFWIYGIFCFYKPFFQMHFLVVGHQRTKKASTKRNTFCFIFPIMEFFGQFVFIIIFFFGWPQISCRTYIHKWYEKDHLEAFFLSRKFHCWMPKKVKWMWEEEIENEAKSVFVNSFLSSSDTYIIVRWKLDEIDNFSWNWTVTLQKQLIAKRHSNFRMQIECSQVREK